MIIINTAVKNLKKNKLINIFSIIQLVVVFILTCFMVSSVFIRYQYYKPFEDYFSSDGLFYYYQWMAFEDPINTSFNENITEDKLISKIKKYKSGFSCSSALMYCEDKNFNNLSYDDEILERYTPELSEGRMLKITDSTDELEVVVSENDYGWNVGDTITIKSSNFPKDCSFKAKIVGKIKDGTKILGAGYYNNNGKINYTNLYYPYSRNIEGAPIMLFSTSSIDKIEANFELDTNSAVIQSISSVGIITLDSADEDDIANIQAQLNQYGEVVTCNLSEFHKNSIDYLLQQIKTLLPIIIVLMIMVLVSSISVSSISTRVRLNDFAIYYINGLQWKQCTLVNVMQSVIISAISILITLISVIIIKFTSLSDSISIILNQYTVSSVLLIMILYLIISMIMPIIIIGKNTPKQILTR